MKICSVGVELFHADGRIDREREREREREDRQTDVLKLIVTSRSFANALGNISTFCSFPILKPFSLLHDCNSAGLDR